MMKKIALGVLILLAAFVSLIIAVFMGETPFLILLFTYIAAVIVLPIYFIAKAILAKRAKKRARRRRRRPAAAKATTPPAKKQANAPQTRKLTRQEIIWPDEILDKKCAYRYEHVGVYVPDISIIDDIAVGRIAFFIQEPHNKFDPRAVAVYTENARTGENLKVGYLYRGQIQDMVNEWEDRGDPTFCQISYVNKQSLKLDKDGIKINISFYK